MAGRLSLPLDSRFWTLDSFLNHQGTKSRREELSSISPCCFQKNSCDYDEPGNYNSRHPGAVAINRSGGFGVLWFTLVPEEAGLERVLEPRRSSVSMN
jgi:hypothetical protein